MESPKIGSKSLRVGDTIPASDVQVGMVVKIVEHCTSVYVGQVCTVFRTGSHTALVRIGGKEYWGDVSFLSDSFKVQVLKLPGGYGSGDDGATNATNGRHNGHREEYLRPNEDMSLAELAEHTARLAEHEKVGGRLEVWSFDTEEWSPLLPSEVKKFMPTYLRCAQSPQSLPPKYLLDLSTGEVVKEDS